MSRREDGDRAARGSWPIRVYRLGGEPGDDLSATTTAAERLAMVWPLTLEAWAMAGKALPTYSRGEAPIRAVPSRVRRPGGPAGPPDPEVSGHARAGHSEDAGDAEDAEDAGDAGDAEDAEDAGDAED
jgi:hypothetical protein